MKFTLRQLEVFLAAAHYENISRAAESLAMSQSAASGALKDLERQFNVQLFDRVGKRLQLNELGRLLRHQAAALLDQAEAVQQELTTHQTVGLLKLGATLTIGDYLATPLMAKFMAQIPGAQMTLSVANTTHIAKQVLNYELDMALIEGEVQPHADLEVIPWQDDELVIVCAADHPWTKKRQLSDQDLLAAPWILREPGSGTRQTFDRAMHGLLPHLRVVLELEHTEAIKRAVSAGLGITCLSKIALEEDIENRKFTRLRVPNRDFRRHFYLLLHRKKYRTAGLQHWLALCLTQGGKTTRLP